MGVHAAAGRGGLNGPARVRAGVLNRSLHVAERPVLVRVAQLSADRVLFGAQADTDELAGVGIERMRRALGIDHDLGEFYGSWAGLAGLHALRAGGVGAAALGV